MSIIIVLGSAIGEGGSGLVALAVALARDEKTSKPLRGMSQTRQAVA